MGAVHRPPQVKMFCALLVAPSIPLARCEQTLQQRFGPIVLRSQPFPFTHTTYYTREMGEDLMRLYVAFDPLIQMADLAAVKHATNAFEAQWADASGHRRVNVDPGYLDLGKVVLATTKDHAHRLYIGAGIYAEVTLRYQQKCFQPWEWTYPDYRLPITQTFFTQLREIYRNQLRQLSTARFKT